MGAVHTTDEWLLNRSRRSRDRTATDRKVKIAEGVEVVQRVHKAPGGLMRATIEIHRGQVSAVLLSGDFFFYPADELAGLEQRLVGTMLPDVQGVVEEFYRSHDIESPGVSPGDWSALLGATEAPQ